KNSRANRRNAGIFNPFSWPVTTERGADRLPPFCGQRQEGCRRRETPGSFDGAALWHQVLPCRERARNAKQLPRCFPRAPALLGPQVPLLFSTVCRTCPEPDLEDLAIGQGRAQGVGQGRAQVQAVELSVALEVDIAHVDLDYLALQYPLFAKLVL